jgi:hypothetical protein
MKPTFLMVVATGSATRSIAHRANLVGHPSRITAIKPVPRGGSSGHHTRYPWRSFWKIADGYLKGEGRHDFHAFRGDQYHCSLLLINNVHALIEFVRAITSH